MRLTLALLLGIAVGTLGTLSLVRSNSGDFLVARTERTDDLERQLRAAELQRDQLNRQLNDVVNRSAKMEATFADLERRFEALQNQVNTEAQHNLER